MHKILVSYYIYAIPSHKVQTYVKMTSLLILVFHKVPFINSIMVVIVDILQIMICKVNWFLNK